MPGARGALTAQGMGFAAMPGMDAERDALQALARFVRTSAFAERGAVMTDLDGTAVHLSLIHI